MSRQPRTHWNVPESRASSNQCSRDRRANLSRVTAIASAAPSNLWGDECCAGGRPIIILGARVPEGDHFVSVFFYYAPGWEEPLRSMHAAFVRYYAEGPRTDVEESALVWTSPARSRETALALARDLVALNRSGNVANAE